MAADLGKESHRDAHHLCPESRECVDGAIDESGAHMASLDASWDISVDENWIQDTLRHGRVKPEARSCGLLQWVIVSAGESWR